MKLRVVMLLVLLSMMPWISACGELLLPTATSIAPDPSATAITPTNRPAIFSQQQLVEDARQLAQIIEHTHPDPYQRGGGRIAFHRRLQQLLEAIPEGGMTRDEFIGLLRPFIGAVGDSHTDIWNDYEVSQTSPGGVPLLFEVVEQSLYVAGVPQGVDQELIGATLVSVEGVPLAELVERQERIRAENEYNALDILTFESLWYRPYMQDLIPEWQDTSQVTVDLQLPGGEIQVFSFDMPQQMTNLHTPPTQVKVPATNAAGLGYSFSDPQNSIAYLRVEHMKNYRERCENGSDSPEHCASIPSATEIFRALVVEMRAAGTETLVVDLRDNEGGDSAMAEILIYYLFGKDAVLSAMMDSLAEGGGDIRRLSNLYLESIGMTLDQVNQGRAVPLQVGDYDFSFDFTDDADKFQALIPHASALYEGHLSEMPTFHAEYQVGTYAGHHTPERILVLVTPGTFSAGATFMRLLYRTGATLVGTPSGQAHNCFGNGKYWRLDQTGIEGTVSSTYYIDFPNDPQMGRVLPVHYPLTYQQLASYGFDPNAEFLYALELLPHLGE